MMYIRRLLDQLLLRGVNWMRSKTIAAATLAIGLTASTALYAGPCVSGSDQDSMRVRMLQTELMVAALSCDRRDGYNAFVTRFENELVGHGTTLRRFFGREFGTRGVQMLNRFITRIANETSQRSSSMGHGYCTRATALFERVAATVPGGLIRVARNQEFSELHGFAPCSTDAVASRPTSAE